MKKISCALAGIALLAAGTAISQVATDPGGEGIVGGDHLDLTAMYVDLNGGDVEFSLDIVGDITATDWGKYMFYVETDNAAAPLAGTDGNGWTRTGITADGTNMNPKYWVAAWVDGGGGGELYSYSGTGTDGGTNGNWLLVDATYFGSPQISASNTANNVIITVPGHLLGSPLTIEAIGMSSGGGGGDTANDSVPSHTDPANWGDPTVLDTPSAPATVPVELDTFTID